MHFVVDVHPVIYYFLRLSLRYVQLNEILWIHKKQRQTRVIFLPSSAGNYYVKFFETYRVFALFHSQVEHMFSTPHKILFDINLSASIFLVSFLTTDNPWIFPVFFIQNKSHWNFFSYWLKAEAARTKWRVNRIVCFVCLCVCVQELYKILMETNWFGLSLAVVWILVWKHKTYFRQQVVNEPTRLSMWARMSGIRCRGFWVMTWRGSRCQLWNKWKV